MPTVLTTYYANAHNQMQDRPSALFVGVTLQEPPFTVDLWARILGPSKELLHAYKYENMPWERFVEKFKIQFQYNKRAVALLDTLAHISLYRDVCLICFEKDPDQCHRSLLQKMMIKRRLEIINEFKMNYALIQGRVDRE